jgi:type IV pilus assembly protein PilF
VKHLCSLVITAFLVGCVVETSSPEPAPVDPVQALEQRVSLARQYIGAGDWENAKRNLELEGSEKEEPIG